MSSEEASPARRTIDLQGRLVKDGVRKRSRIDISFSSIWFTPFATGRETRPPELDRMAEVFAVAGEKQETVADNGTIALLNRFAGDPDIENARAEFDRAQKVEERFHKDFEWPRLRGKGDSH
jgi:hypothetical protein